MIIQICLLLPISLSSKSLISIIKMIINHAIIVIFLICASHGLDHQGSTILPDVDVTINSLNPSLVACSNLLCFLNEGSICVFEVTVPILLHLQVKRLLLRYSYWRTQ